MDLPRFGGPLIGIRGRYEIAEMGYLVMLGDKTERHRERKRNSGDKHGFVSYSTAAVEQSSDIRVSELGGRNVYDFKIIQI